MVEIINKDEFKLHKEEIFEWILDGAVFIYGTDTIYGIGCDATNSKAVAKIREIKERYEQPFSIIAPSKKWIIENCGKFEELDKLPGPYTLILKLKNKERIADEISPGRETIGVRIPDNWFSEVVAKLGRPIVTTSVNRHGEQFMTSMENLDKEIKNRVDFIINEGKISGNPSTLIDLTAYEKKITKR